MANNERDTFKIPIGPPSRPQKATLEISVDGEIVTGIAAPGVRASRREKGVNRATGRGPISGRACAASAGTSTRPRYSLAVERLAGVDVTAARAGDARTGGKSERIHSHYSVWAWPHTKPGWMFCSCTVHAAATVMNVFLARSMNLRVNPRQVEVTSTRSRRTRSERGWLTWKNAHTGCEVVSDTMLRRTRGIGVMSRSSPEYGRGRASGARVR